MAPKEIYVNTLMMVNIWQAINFRFQILDMAADIRYIFDEGRLFIKHIPKY